MHCAVTSKSSVKRTPKYISAYVHSNSILFMAYVKWEFFLPKCMTYTLFDIKRYLPVMLLLFREFVYIIMQLYSILIVINLGNIVVSSANFKIELMMLMWISFMKFKNRTGPRTDPCSTPPQTSLQCDLSPCVHTSCFLSLNQPLIQAKLSVNAMCRGGSRRSGRAGIGMDVTTEC